MLRFSLALILCAGLPAKPPVSHEALWKMKRVSSPVPSPDGRWVVFSVLEPDYDEKNQVSDLWIVPADGSAPPRRLTSSKAAESSPAWSPDSRRLAFVAKREGDEATQVYLLDLAAGGEAARLTAVQGGAAAPVFSPDGNLLLFTSQVDPQADARRKRKYNARVYDGFPIRYWDRWLDDAKPHPFIQPLAPGATARDLLAGTKLASLTGFDGVSGGIGGPASLDAVWAPGGDSVVFACVTTRDRAAYAPVPSHLYRVRLEGGEPVALTSGEDSHTKPLFHPDGKSLYSLYRKRTAKVYNSTSVARMGWPEPGQPAVLTAAFDRSVNSMALTPGGDQLYLLAEDAGLEKLYRCSASGGAVEQAFPMDQGVYGALSIPLKSARTLLIATWESSVQPAEVVRIDPPAGAHRRLTGFAVADAEALDWMPPRHFWFTSQGGKRIHNMIVLPPSFREDGKYPLFHLIHGGPNNMWRDQITLRWNYHLLAKPGYVVLLTNYTGSTGFGERFAQQIEGDPFLTPGNELNEAVDQAARQFPFIDASRAAAGGASYGGSLANWLLATTTRYRCLINHAGIFNLESMWGTTDIAYWMEARLGGPVWEQGEVWRKQNPPRLAPAFRTPILVTHGERDFRVPLNQALELWSYLQRRRVPSRLVVFPDENHWILNGENSKYYYEVVHQWLNQYLMPR